MDKACCKSCGVKLTADNNHCTIDVGAGPQEVQAICFHEYTISGYCGKCLRPIVDTVMSTATRYSDVNDRNRHLDDVFEQYGDMKTAVG